MTFRKKSEALSKDIQAMLRARAHSPKVPDFVSDDVDYYTEAELDDNAARDEIVREARRPRGKK